MSPIPKISGIDCPKSLMHNTGEFVGQGYKFFGRYLSDHIGTDHESFTEAEAKHISENGGKLVSIAEFGRPTDTTYPFTAAHARQNVAKSVHLAALAGQPKGTCIFETIDYDSRVSEVQDYLIAFHDGLKAEGFLHGVYGNGITCQWAKTHGYAHHTWLSLSKGFAGYSAWVGQADIVQLTTVNLFGFDCDTNYAKSQDFGWWQLP